MPSPFPGMDPYLEDPANWRGVHTLLVGGFTALINRQLPDDLVAKAEERCYVLPRRQEAIPDSAILRSPVAPDRRNSGAAAILVPPPAVEADAAYTPPLVFEVEGVVVREPYIEIVAVRPDERVVAVLEVLSPSNKALGHHGRTEYIQKREAVLDSGSHLLEIDLLREGAHTVAMSREGIAAEKPFDYVACLHRAGNGRKRFECWPFGLREEMPRILIPLTADLPDLAFDLRSLLNRVYEDGAFRRSIEYSREPEPPLSASDAAWADALLREKGLRGLKED